MMIPVIHPPVHPPCADVVPDDEVVSLGDVVGDRVGTIVVAVRIISGIKEQSWL